MSTESKNQPIDNPSGSSKGVDMKAELDEYLKNSFAYGIDLTAEERANRIETFAQMLRGTEFIDHASNLEKELVNYPDVLEISLSQLEQAESSLSEAFSVTLEESIKWIIEPDLLKKSLLRNFNEDLNQGDAKDLVKWFQFMVTSMDKYPVENNSVSENVSIVKKRVQSLRTVRKAIESCVSAIPSHIGKILEIVYSYPPEPQGQGDTSTLLYANTLWDRIAFFTSPSKTDGSVESVLSKLLEDLQKSITHQYSWLRLFERVAERHPEMADLETKTLIYDFKKRIRVYSEREAEMRSHLVPASRDKDLFDLGEEDVEGIHSDKRYIQLIWVGEIQQIQNEFWKDNIFYDVDKKWMRPSVDTTPLYTGYQPQKVKPSSEE